MVRTIDFATLTVGEIRSWLKQAEPDQKQTKLLLSDARIGVRKLIEAKLRERMKSEATAAWQEQMWQHERAARAEGFRLIAGVDEAGRGPLAGPVVAAAVILPEGIELPGLNDSKQVAEEHRGRLFDLIKEAAVAYGIGVVDVPYIDRYNILQGTFEAARQAIERMNEAFAIQPDFLLTDYLKIPECKQPYQAIVKGDASSFSIAAASILAKVTRDRLMEEYANEYPQYGFDRHKGYASPEHMEALQAHGPCPIHRASFAPVQKLLQGSLFDFVDQ